jgi:hypothetical protein
MSLESTEDVLPPGVVTIADTGRDVLAGRKNWLTLRPFDRWLGGVHLRYDDPLR